MVQKQVNQLNEFVLNELRFVGLEFVRNARTNANFTDRTGNLRSSIGYIIFKDGRPIEDNFEEAGSGTDKATGKSRGYQYGIENFKSTMGYVLLVVAGMQYAAAVESKGFDVLTTSSFLAEESLKTSLERIKKAFNV